MPFHPKRPLLRSSRLTAAAAALLAAACGSSTTDTGGGNNGIETMAKATPSGDLQQANPNQQLAAPFRIVITKNGAPVSGRAVSWTVTTGDGSVTPGSSLTGTDGVATTVATLGTQSLTVAASSDGVAGSPLNFTAGVIGLLATVTVQNNSFSPQTVFVKVGGTVTFTWATGAAGHTVTPDDGKTVPASPDQPNTHSNPFTFNATFNATGDYYYHCLIHGGTRTGMFGKITVVP